MSTITASLPNSGPRRAPRETEPNPTSKPSDSKTSNASNASNASNTSTAKLSPDRVSFSEEAKTASASANSGVNLAVWQQPESHGGKALEGPTKAPEVVTQRPSMTLKKASSPKSAQGSQKLAPVVRPKEEVRKAEAAPSEEIRKAEPAKGVNLRSRVSDLNSTSTSLRSSEERIADLGNQIDV